MGAAIGVLAVPGMCLVTSCATVESITATQTGCGQGEIQISDDSSVGNTRTWLATCRGQRFRCAHVAGGDSRCTPEAMPPAGPPPIPGPGVQRVQGVGPNGAPIALVVAELDAGPYHFHVESAPSVDRETVRWIISAPVQQLGPSCQAGVMIDGIINDFTIVGVRATADRAEYTTTLPMVAVRAMASGGRVVGRICTDEWRLDDAAAAVIRELVARIDEESTWQAPQTSGGEAPPQPPGGVPTDPELR